MDDAEKPPTPVQKAKAARQAALAQALRANLRRRKQAPSPDKKDPA